MMTRSCPCGSGLDYRVCCDRFISGRDQPASAEALMRSRYTAYTQANAAYLLATWHPDQCIGLSSDALQKSAQGTDWQRLEILSSDGAGTATTGTVEFKAWYRQAGQLVALHERSRFVRDGSQWLYVDGELDPPNRRQPNVNENENVNENVKVSRNAPCPCGSGKKFKRCCG